MKHALPFVCATLVLASGCASAQSVAPLPPLPAASPGTDPSDPRSQPAAPVLPALTPAQEPAPGPVRAPLPGSEVLEEDDPRLDAVKDPAPAPRTPRALPVLDARHIERLKGLESERTAGLLRAAYPLADMTHHRGWGLAPEVLGLMLEPASGRYSQVLLQCGVHEGAPLRLLEVQARQARDGALAARDRRSDVPDVIGSMSPSGRYASALRLTRVGTGSPVLTLLQKPSSTRIELVKETMTEGSDPSVLVRQAPLALLDLPCPDGSVPDAALEDVLQELFPKGGSGTGRLMLAQVALGELSSPGAMRVPGAAQAPVHVQTLAHEGSVVLSAYVRAAGVGAADAFERVLQRLAAHKASPVSLTRTVLDGRGSATARFVFDGYEFVLGMQLDASGERLTLAFRKP